ncbi:hypothetical protein Syun_013482 [Stephania yunnanensis]|uniref:Uncharacterized protein n=1 Tax=Stephania yunnanensis TaxID=152371 RepID=A0AAP0P7M4_9MAGN
MLEKWHGGNYFSPDFKVWKTGQSQEAAILLTDALALTFKKAKKHGNTNTGNERSTKPTLNRHRIPINRDLILQFCGAPIFTNMSIFKTLVGFSSLITLLSLSSAINGEASASPSAYEVLEKFNFPKGILPVGVTDYSLHEDGRFDVFLDRDCEFKIEEEGYTLYYKRKISGKLGLGSLTELQGVSVKVVFVWIGISEVDNRGGDQLNFFVGPLSASFPLQNFQESPQCSKSVFHSLESI